MKRGTKVYYTLHIMGTTFFIINLPAGRQVFNSSFFIISISATHPIDLFIGAIVSLNGLLHRLSEAPGKGNGGYPAISLQTEVFNNLFKIGPAFHILGIKNIPYSQSQCGFILHDLLRQSCRNLSGWIEYFLYIILIFADIKTA